MRKTNSANTILLLGVALSFICSFFLRNILLGVIVFIVSFGFVMYKQRAAFLASSAASAYKKGQIEKSFMLYEKAIQLEGCPGMVKILYAYRLISEGKINEGAKILGTLSYDTMDDNERLNYNATNALSIWKQGGLHRAIEIYEALLNDKDSILIYETLGYLLICAKNYKKALEFNLKAFEFNNTSERIKCNLATSYYYAGHEKEAVKLYKELIADYANFPEPYYYYALILQRCEKYKGALKYFNMALEKKFSHIYTLTEEDIQCKLKEVGGHIGA
ncbi:MAG: tetratricopeptide repeat protein [Zhenhengia sp.]|uniref:tetratricopeptide repeat protein n=1 Tax=Zhenhengia sp. TaxID=2944208 RepID=UPI00399682E8